MITTRISLLLVLALLAGNATAQNPPVQAAGAFFFFDAATFAAKDTTKGRIEVFVKVAYSELLFTRYQNKLFRARYDIEYQVRDLDENIVASEVQDKEIVSDNYDATISDVRFHFSRMTFNVAPGDYQLTAVITDKETMKSGQRKLRITVRTFRARPLAISDLIFADKIQTDTLDQIFNIVPNVFKSFDHDYKDYLIYFEIYNQEFSSQYSDDSDKSGAKEIKIIYLVRNVNQKIIYADSLIKESWRFQTFSSIKIDKEKVKFGKYILDVVITDGRHVAKTKTIFNVRASTFAATALADEEFDLDQAIRQLKHIARSVNLGKVLKREVSEKEKFFDDFWTVRDPTPDTKNNELMIEYYRRIDYANRYFSAGVREGWDSDRGMVYVVAGTPDNIERHPFDPNSKPYEVWFYYTYNLRLVFVDFLGFGDYDLYNRQDFEHFLFVRR